MTVVQEASTTPLNVIELEILRHRLEAVTTEAGRTIERTAISPVVVEGGDYCTAVLDARGGLIAGGGKLVHQFYVATHAVKRTLARHDDIRPGDVYLTNDPHDGGGLHPQDVLVLRPVFVDGELVVWMTNSAHMMDMGGMVPGSFSPNATDCYQESVRVPPVRLVREGVEQRDLWSMLLNNVRLSTLVEMDLRALVASTFVGHERMAELVQDVGVARFSEGVADLQRRTRAAIGDRIADLANGVYRSTSWAEWHGERFKIPCALHIDGSSMTFDYDGAAPQTENFLNSKEHVVKSMLSMFVGNYLLGDLPLNQGYLDAFDVRCPLGSVLNATPPAPVAAAHLLACMDAMDAGVRCLLAAGAASPDSHVGAYLAGYVPPSAQAILTWAGRGHAGDPDAWLMLDGCALGSAAASDRDGSDFYYEMVSRQGMLEQNDIEITEAWYPLRFSYLRRGSTGGPGQWRGGAGVELAYQTTGSTPITGTSIGEHGQFPCSGAAGGLEGQPSRISIRHADGSERELSLMDQGFHLAPGDEFVCISAGGGGWSDPLYRNPALVEHDVEEGRLSEAHAREVYGVVLGDPSATAETRELIGQRRLAAARAATKPLTASEVDDSLGEVPLPLAPGVEQRGRVALSAKTGAALAVAPDHWTDGCPVLIEAIAHGLERRSYLDPQCGYMLHVEVTPAGEPRSFESRPMRWIEAGS